MLTALPLHIWDRELESRIILTILALKNNSDVLLGHEYNIAPIYNKLPQIFHYGAGRPINVSPRTDRWYTPIKKNGGHVGLVYEEGINDIFSPIASDSFVGIDKISLDALSIQYNWCEEEIDLMTKAITEQSLKDQLAKKCSIVGNPRFEMLGNLGKHYFWERAEALKQIFGDYILISDNFGATQVYGSNGPIKIDRDIRQVAKDNDASKIIHRYNTVVDQINESRESFTKIINSIIKAYPNITFIFRPHPLADSSQWHRDLVKARNLIILMRDSIEPFIFGSLGMIHAGCTTGLQSELAKVPTIDLTKLFDDKRAESAASLMATYRPTNGSELAQNINSIIKVNPAQYHSGSSRASLKEILDLNIDSLEINKLNSAMNGMITYPKVSSFSKINENLIEHSNTTERFNREKVVRYMASLRGKQAPNPIKARNYSIKDIKMRIENAISSLGYGGMEPKILKTAPNTFYIYRL